MKVTLNPVFESMRGNLDGIVYYTCHGKVRARLYAVPRDPKTPAQRARRRAFSDAVAAWKMLSVEEKNCWKAHGKRKRVSGYNAFISAYLKKETAPTTVQSQSAPSPSAYPGASRPANGTYGFNPSIDSLESTSFSLFPSYTHRPVKVSESSICTG